MNVGLLRRRDPDPYFTPEPDPDPVVIVKPGGAMVDEQWLAEEIVRTGAEESRRQAEADATRALQERDAEERREATESMERWLREQAARELPEHLRNRGAGD
jgi:hypothetical protein